MLKMHAALPMRPIAFGNSFASGNAGREE
jgi:hypothetical protein